MAWHGGGRSAGHVDRRQGRPCPRGCRRAVADALQQGVRGGYRRGAAGSVVAVEPPVPDEGEAVAADPAGIGGHDPEDEVGSDGGVHGIAPLAEDGGAGVGGEVVGRGQAGGGEAVSLRRGSRRAGQPSSTRRNSAVRWPWRAWPAAASCTS